MSLFDSKDLRAWAAARDSYCRALDTLAARKKDPTKLQALDKWFYGPKVTKLRTFVIDKAALVKVVEWKLSRGTFRPGLLQKAQSNSDQSIKDAFVQARDVLLAVPRDGAPGAGGAAPAELLDAALKAVKFMEKALFGVGPATATAVLSRYFPDLVAFMSDEAMLECKLFGRPSDIKYDMKTFGRFNSAVQGKARELCAASGKADWTGDDVARALWAARVLGASAGGAGASSSASAASSATKKAPASPKGSSTQVRKNILKKK